MKMAFVIPVYKHGKTLENVVANLVAYGFPIIVVDDGNDAENKTAIASVATTHKEVILVTRDKNGGKGRAVSDGAKKASEIGMTHIFQIDSDGQHDVADVPAFLELAEKFPEDLICGFPEYDETVPASRKNGREISNRWTRICTLDKSIVDVLCGFRIYPVAPFMKILRKRALIAGRMGFDVEIFVRFIWKGVNVKWHSVHVSYPKDGISNFHLVRDNIAISLVFTKLFLGMIVRFPILLYRIIRNNGKQSAALD